MMLYDYLHCKLNCTNGGLQKCQEFSSLFLFLTVQFDPFCFIKYPFCFLLFQCKIPQAMVQINYKDQQKSIKFQSVLLLCKLSENLQLCATQTIQHFWYIQEHIALPQHHTVTVKIHNLGFPQGNLSFSWLVSYVVLCCSIHSGKDMILPVVYSQSLHWNYQCNEA